MKNLLMILSISTILVAQTINVKYRPTPVTINNNFKCLITDSSLVYKACYDKANQYMIINLQGTWYHYCNMPFIFWNNFTNEESLGQHYREFIRGEFDCRKGYIPKY